MQDNKQNEKMKKILDNLKSKPFSQQKSSSQLLQTIERQRKAAALSQIENHDEMYQLIMKQRDVVLKLNQENVNLIQQNVVLETTLKTTDHKQKRIEKINLQLNEQNSSLKQQLLISQMNCAKMVKQVNRLKSKVNQKD
jgi:hypothetical protein